jgi:hypothetical protein
MRGAKKTTASGNDLVEAILLERRKDFTEKDMPWFDIIRNQKPLKEKEITSITAATNRSG